jgi:SAM-dependent methyltransferase
MTTSREELLGLINASWTTQAIGAACELGLPDLLLEGSRDAAAVARLLQADPDAVRRLLRALATLGICVERPGGGFGLAPAGKYLCREREDSLDAWARMSATRLWGNWAGLCDSVRSGRSTRSRVQDVDDFSHLDRNGPGADLFNAAMLAYTLPVAHAAARRLDWNGVATLVDVGGGMGELAAAILSEHPGMRGIVYDLDHARRAAIPHLERAGVGDRCEFAAGSFFDSVPAADACLLKSVLHNWDDERALAILRRCAEALRPGGRVVLFERVIAERPGSSRHDREGARSDLNMLVGCDGRERTEAAFGELLAAASLSLRATIPLVEGFSALEARP